MLVTLQVSLVEIITGASKFLSHKDKGPLTSVGYEFVSLEVEGLSDEFLDAGVYQIINEFIGLGHQQ